MGCWAAKECMPCLLSQERRCRRCAIVAAAAASVLHPSTHLWLEAPDSAMERAGGTEKVGIQGRHATGGRLKRCVAHCVAHGAAHQSYGEHAAPGEHSRHQLDAAGSQLQAQRHPKSSTAPLHLPVISPDWLVYRWILKPSGSLIWCSGSSEGLANVFWE